MVENVIVYLADGMETDDMRPGCTMVNYGVLSLLRDQRIIDQGAYAAVINGKRWALRCQHRVFVKILEAATLFV